MKLEKTNHNYYCECWETQRLEEYDSWEEFILKNAYDKDYNLLFRYDIEETYDENGEKVVGYELQLHHALQRHGRDLFHIVIYNIKEENMENIKKWLKERKEHILDLWKEV